MQAARDNKVSLDLKDRKVLLVTLEQLVQLEAQVSRDLLVKLD